MSYNAYLELPGSGLDGRQIVGGADSRAAAWQQIRACGHELSKVRIEWAGEGPEPVLVEDAPQVFDPIKAPCTLWVRGPRDEAGNLPEAKADWRKVENVSTPDEAEAWIKKFGPLEQDCFLNPPDAPPPQVSPPAANEPITTEPADTSTTAGGE